MMMHPAPQRINVRWPTALAVLIVACSIGCSSNKPTISGFGIGGQRSVSVGDRFEIRLPVAENGARLWRVTSYDSFYLTLGGNARADTTTEGSEIVIPVLARHAGETDIEVTQRITAQDRLAGRAPKLVRFHIRIVP